MSSTCACAAKTRVRPVCAAEVYKGVWQGTEVAIKRFLDQNLSDAIRRDFKHEVCVGCGRMGEMVHSVPVTVVPHALGAPVLVAPAPVVPVPHAGCKRGQRVLCGRMGVWAKVLCGRMAVWEDGCVGQSAVWEDGCVGQRVLCGRMGGRAWSRERERERDVLLAHAGQARMVCPCVCVCVCVRARAYVDLGVCEGHSKAHTSLCVVMWYTCTRTHTHTRAGGDARLPLRRSSSCPACATPTSCCSWAPSSSPTS